MKLAVLVPVPPGVVTAIVPVFAPLGTIASTVVSLITSKLPAATPPNVTLVVPLNVFPVIVTAVPTGPLVGLKLPILGGIASGPLLADPPAVVTTIFCLVLAPAGTIAVTDVSETTLNDAAGKPPIVTAEVCVRLTPVSVTVAPTVALAGLKDISCGVTLKIWLLL